MVLVGFGLGFFVCLGGVGGVVCVFGVFFVVVFLKQFLLDLELSFWRTLQECLTMSGNCSVLVLSLRCLVQ